MMVYGWPHTTTQALPTSIATLAPTPYSDPHLRVTYLRFFHASLPQLTFLQKFLLRHYQPPSSPLRQHRIRIPLLALPYPTIFPASLRPF